jgi:hypothetical protein
MSSNLSIADVLARLEAQIAWHRERETHHGEQEAFHRDQRSVHTAQLEALSRSLESFKAAAGSAVDLATRAALPRTNPKEIEEFDTGRRRVLSRMVARIVEEVEPNARFGTRWVVEEVDRRFGEILRKRADPRMVSSALRRMERKGLLHVARRGGPYREALYVREETR